MRRCSAPVSATATPEAARRAGDRGRRLPEPGGSTTGRCAPRRAVPDGVFGPTRCTPPAGCSPMIWRSFVRGRVGVPAAGMESLIEDRPAAAARPRPAEHPGHRHRRPAACTGDRGRRAGPGRDRRDRPGRRRAAAARPARSRSAGAGDHLPRRRRVPGQTARSCSSMAPAAPESPTASSLSLAAPGYAPPGRHLIATTAPAEAGLDEPALRRHLADLYGRPTGSWEHIATVRAEPGLVTAPPPQGELRKPVRLSDTLFVGGRPPRHPVAAGRPGQRPPRGPRGA